MSFHQNNFFSSTLMRNVPVNVILPTPTEAELQTGHKWPTIWLLHGLSDDASAWARKTNLEALIDADYPFTIVMPQTDRGFYNNIKGGQQYFDFISTELIDYMRYIFPLDPRPEKNIVMGNSMGGYGALRLGLTFPDTFAGIVALSPATDLTAFEKEQSPLLPEFNQIFRDQDLEHSSVAIPYLLENISSSTANRLKIYMATGTADFLREMDLRARSQFAAKFKDNFTWHESQGHHNWRLWNNELPAVLDWCTEIFNQ